MKLRFFSSLAALLCLVVALAAVGLADKKDAESQAAKAATVFKEIMGTPDKSVPKAILNKARCVGVFPQVLKAGFIVGGRGGRGVISCRVKGGWSGPAYFDLKGGSIGLQIGAQATDFVLLFMTDNGIEGLLKSKFEVGGDASVAAGPVGRTVSAATDAMLKAQILSYSRSKGLFAGLELKGSVITQDESNNKAAYGDSATGEAILRGKVAAPATVKIYPTTLARYSKVLKK